MKNAKYTETLLLQGHIIDSLTFSKVLDRIMDRGGRFTIDEFKVGQRKNERSRALLQVESNTQARLDDLLKELRNLGAEVLEKDDVTLAPAPKIGVFPDGFYATTNLETWIRLRSRWLRVRGEQMDAGIRVDRRRSSAETVRFGGVKRGELFVVGHQGGKVVPLERPRDGGLFEFMASEASTEKPKTAFIRQIADAIRQTRKQSPPGKVLVVAGPAVVHTGAHPDLTWLIEHGFVHILFAGNALAAHDLEANLFGTSLGLSLKSGAVTHGGHEHHLRAINLIRKVGSIRAAVRRRLITGGVFAACVRKKVPYVLAGSIRDDGPLPEVITDVLQAQRAMREHLQG